MKQKNNHTPMMNKVILFLMCISYVGWINGKEITIREDVNWNYGLYDMNRMTPTSDEIMSFRFEGHVIRGGRDYSVFVDPSGSDVAWLREENGRVFLYTGEGAPSGFFDCMGEDEFLLYDYNAHVGDEYACLGFDDRGSGYGMVIHVVVEKTEKVMYGCYEYNRLYLRVKELEHTTSDVPFVITEMAGGELGLLPFPQYGVLTSINGKKEAYKLFSLTGMDGIVIYRNDASGISVEVNSPPKISNPHIFDLQGRELSAPLPGQPYIRGGKVLVEAK